MLKVSIRKKLGSFSLWVDFETDGGTLGILGASGCGKSMTLRCIAGLIRPDEGYIELNGRVLFDSARHIDLPPRQRRVGYLFQSYALFPNMTVEQNIAAGILCRKGREEKTAGLIRAFYLEGLEKHRPAQLSGGQQQRVALARILAGEPELLMLDEPFSALDDYLRWQVELELSDILKTYPGPVLFVSHSRDEVYRRCDRVCVLDAGRAEPVVSVKELFEAPTTLSACLLSGCKNVSRAEKRGKTAVYALDWGVELETGRQVPDRVTHVGIRAHYLDPEGRENRIPCQVERVVEEVFSTVLMLTTPAGSAPANRLRLEIDKKAGSAAAGQTQLTIGVRPQDILLLTQGDRP